MTVRTLVALVGVVTAVVVTGCTSTHGSDSTLPAVVTGYAWRPAASCADVVASRTEKMTPPAQSRLTMLLHVGGAISLLPVPASYRSSVPVAAVWSKAQLVLERKARYQVFLARVRSPLGKRGEFNGQVFWVVLAEGVAGTDNSSIPPGASPPPDPSACVFYDRYGYSILSATTVGRPLVVG
jgi:hypothetical protein